ncbi:MAG: class I SAM-dependent methyltransferase [Pirellulales bacterium]|nr:class I SAM-dependent methyltransferase [Pirellulales bacterium]
MDESVRIYTGTELEAMSVAVNYHRWILDWFTPYLGNRVAEVGAGIGSVSKLLLERPLGQLTSFEPSRNLFPRLEEALRGETRATPVPHFFSERDRSNRFDSVLYLNVLEHIDDDRGEVGTVYEALNPGGHLLVFVPALQWLYREFDRQLEHHRRYSTRSLARLVVDAGYEIRFVRYFDIAGILPWFVMCKLLRLRPSGRSVSLYDKIVVPAMRFAEGILPPPVGKNLLLVAQRTG